jgi:hypothetical protein
VMQTMLFWTTLLKKMLRLDNAAEFLAAMASRVSTPCCSCVAARLKRSDDRWSARRSRRPDRGGVTTFHLRDGIVCWAASLFTGRNLPHARIVSLLCSSFHCSHTLAAPPNRPQRRSTSFVLSRSLLHLSTVHAGKRREQAIATSAWLRIIDTLIS